MPKRAKEAPLRRKAREVLYKLEDAYGGDGWDDPRLIDITEKWVTDNDLDRPTADVADELIEASFDPRDL